MNLDDAVFFFGRENDWKIKVGRFEAYDMSRRIRIRLLNIGEYSERFSDAYGYIYMMKEATGT